MVKAKKRYCPITITFFFLNPFEKHILLPYTISLDAYDSFLLSKTILVQLATAKIYLWSIFMDVIRCLIVSGNISVRIIFDVAMPFDCFNHDMFISITWDFLNGDSVF